MKHTLCRVVGALSVIALPLLGASLLITSCAQAKPNVSASVLNLNEAVDLPTKLNCTNHDFLADDINFYDQMSGVNCLYDDDSSVLIRAYKNESSVQQVLVDWAPTINTSNQIIVGANWFAVGTLKRLEQLSEVLHINDVSASTSITPSPRPLTEMQKSIGTCSAFVGITARSALYDPDAHARNAAAAELVYPGLSEITTAIVTQLKNDPALTEQNFGVKIAPFGPHVKSYCAQLPPSHIQEESP